MINTNIAVAIDGPAASGKSTVAKTLAKRLGLIMVNTGTMYRAIAWATIHHGVDANDNAGVVDLIGKLDLKCGVVDGLSTIIVDGKSLGRELREEPVNQRVSIVAQVPEVRSLLVKKQRDYLEIGSLVMEGRDIGSVVFPNTPFKMYIDASEEVRAARRKAEGIDDSLVERDKKDSERKVSPLMVADGAVVIDSSEMNIDEVVAAAVKVLKERGAPTDLVNI